MFLRRYERRSGGRRRTYWALVESVRTGRGSRQRVVAYLGELKRSEQNGWAQLGRSLSGKRRPQPSLFDPPHYDDPSDDEPVLVQLRGVRLERLRDFGDVWMALGLWRLLGLDTLLEGLAARGREDVPWPMVAAILTLARFCEPQSELHIETTWYRRTALEDLLGVAVEKIHTDRLYGGLDWLLPHKSAIEKHLKDRLGSLFDVKYELLLYDVTSTYFGLFRRICGSVSQHVSITPDIASLYIPRGESSFEVEKPSTGASSLLRGYFDRFPLKDGTREEAPVLRCCMSDVNPPTNSSEEPYFEGECKVNPMARRGYSRDSRPEGPSR